MIASDAKLAGQMEAVLQMGEATPSARRLGIDMPLAAGRQDQLVSKRRIKHSMVRLTKIKQIMDRFGASMPCMVQRFNFWSHSSSRSSGPSP